MQFPSTFVLFRAALALHLSLADAFLPAAFKRAASHLLGPASGRSPRTAVAQFSARHSHTAWSPPQEPALPKAAVYLPSTLRMHGASTLGSPLAATLAWQASSPASFLPSAFSFAAVHSSAWAGGAATARKARAANTRP